MVTLQIRKNTNYVCDCKRRYVNSLDMLKYIIKQTLLDVAHHANADMKYEAVNYWLKNFMTYTRSDQSY